MPLLLTQTDVKRILTMSLALETTENAFKYHATEAVEMPPKLYLFFKEFRGDLRVMPAYIPELRAAGVKIVNVHPENAERHIPTVMATILLVDPKTGQLIAIMDGTWITNMRTGAAGGIAAKYLARKDSKRLGLVGAGAQAETQVLAIREVLAMQEYVAWSPNPRKFEAFAGKMKKEYGISVRAAQSAQEACNADIVCTTTPSRVPIVQKDWIRPGTHINAIGADAPGKEELDPALLKMSTIIIDEWEQAIHSGEVNVPISTGKLTKHDIQGTLGEVVTSKKRGRKNENDITIFDSTGLAIQDLATAHKVHQMAIHARVGQEISI